MFTGRLMLFAMLARMTARIAAQARLLFSVTEARADVDYPVAPSDVAAFHRVSAGEHTVAVDDSTWKDMLADEYAERLSDQASIFGRQMLYRRLRAGSTGDELDMLGARLADLMANPAQLDKLHHDIRCLRTSRSEVSALLFEAEAPAAPRWIGFAWMLPLALLASIALVLLTPMAWLLTGAVLYVLISAQLRYGGQVEEWKGKLHSLQMLLRACSATSVGERAWPANSAGQQSLAARLNRSLSRSAMFATVPGAREYADWFMLDNVKHLFASNAIVFGQRDFLRECFQRVATLEADIALARHLLKTPVWCRAQRRVEPGLMLRQAIHPLLPNAVPLDMELQGQGAFISGQNGIGKSTFLRTIGLNLISARAFGFCYARQASLPLQPLYASMQSEDSLLGGESLYMAELRRAQELLASSEGSNRGIYIIDEIFRGTNYLESVSAAASVLNRLSEKGLVIVSSHNLVLGSLLAHRLARLCVTAPDGDRSKLRLVPGVLESTNGIALLSARGFDPAISADADRVFEWLESYLASPADCAEVWRAE